MRNAIFAGHPHATGQVDQQAQPLHLPKPQPFGAPVLITDVATPLAGETVLSLLLKRMMAED